MQETIVRVKNKDQLNAVKGYTYVSGIIADFCCPESSLEDVRKELPDTDIYIQLPDVLREKRAESVEKIAERAFAYGKVVIKNLDEAGLVQQMMKGTGRTVAVIGDAFLYAYNASAIAFYKQLFPEMKFITSDEISDRELESMIKNCEEAGLAKRSDFIYKAYGYQPLMITDQCMNRTYTGCMEPLMKFTDEKNNDFYVTSECGQCYDIVYNGLPTLMTDSSKEDISCESILLDFTLESESETKTILDAYFNGKGNWQQIIPKYTRGHHIKGCL